MNNTLKILITSSLIGTSGCMKAGFPVSQMSQNAAQSIGCSNFKSSVFDTMYEYLDKQNEAPDLAVFTQSLNEKIDQLAEEQKIHDTRSVEKLKTEMAGLYSILIEKSVQMKHTKTAREHLETIIELEMKDISTQANVSLNADVAAHFAKVESISQSLDVQCGNGATSTPSNPGDNADSGSSSGGSSGDSSNSGSGTTTPPTVTAQARMIAGSHNVFATAYQSCKALDIPEIDAGTDDVVGISRVGTHSDGIGGKREVTNLSKVQTTHPYIRVASSSSQNGCFNVQGNPLIYDYGGSPSVSNNVLDFFTNAGSGTNALGVDCSAYVSSAIGAAGFRYKPGTDNKAIYVRQSSSKFINATKSGFTCFQNVTATPSVGMLPGDIIAVSGHVVMVDKVGADPFGLKKLASISECSSLNVSNFDFVLSQSSPSKNGIGLNRYIARDYLKESSSMATAFKGIGKAVCEARFGNKNVATPSSSYGMIRHKGTADCLSPKIALKNQSCVSACLQ